MEYGDCPHGKRGSVDGRGAEGKEDPGSRNSQSNPRAPEGSGPAEEKKTGRRFLLRPSYDKFNYLLLLLLLLLPEPDELLLDDPELLLEPDEPDLTVPEELLALWPDDLTEELTEPEDDLPELLPASLLDLTVDLTVCCV